MKKILSLIALILISSQSQAALIKGTVAKFSCDFPGAFEQDKYSFLVDLKSGKVRGSDKYDDFNLRSHTQKGFQEKGRLSDIKTFNLGTKDNAIRTLVLDGDNNDDTDYLVTISYQSACGHIIFKAGGVPSCSEANVFATFTFFPDSDLDNPDVVVGKNCKMKILK